MIFEKYDLEQTNKLRVRETSELQREKNGGYSKRFENSNGFSYSSS